jgi:uncharacterized repeat protein (TIGR03837 family)
MTPQRYDVFCRIVDNFGDAGVCWRLCRLLAQEHGVAVRLWIDDATRLAALAPAVDPALASQQVDGVDVRRYVDATQPGLVPAEVVIEAFGCGLPAAYLDALETRRHVWILLEYLSAEEWVDASHGLPSPQPQRPLTRWFFFPGFTRATGGLLREHGLLAAREQFVAPPVIANALRISLFCYENAALPALLDAWSVQATPVHAHVPLGVAPQSVAEWWGHVPAVGECALRGALTLECVPWVDQPTFDRQLWASDLNFVRGEDSFVRAQWAGKPLVWHIYPQDDAAHRMKLAAFLDRYLEGADPPYAATVRAFWLAFDREDGAATAAAWPALRDALAAGNGGHERAWASHLAGLPELSAALVEFAKKRYN